MPPRLPVTVADPKSSSEDLDRRSRILRATFDSRQHNTRSHGPDRMNASLEVADTSHLRVLNGRHSWTLNQRVAGSSPARLASRIDELRPLR